MNKIKVSIIINCYNQEKILYKCFDSILMQKTNFIYEIIATDDNSTDNTRQIILQYVKKYPHIIKYNFETKNSILNRNIKIRAYKNFSLAEGEYLAILDGDDYWIDNNKLQMQVDFLDKNPTFSCCFAISDYKDSKTNKHIQFFPNNIGEKKIFTLNDVTNNYFAHISTIVYRYSKYKQIILNNFFSKIINADRWYQHFFALLGPFYFIDKVVSVRTINGENNLWANKNATADSRNCQFPTEIINLPLELSKIFKLFNQTYPPHIFTSTLVNVFNSAIKLHRLDVINEIVENFPQELLTVLYSIKNNSFITTLFLYCLFLQKINKDIINNNTELNKNSIYNIFITGYNYSNYIETLKILLKYKNNNIQIFCDITKIEPNEAIKLQEIGSTLYDTSINFVKNTLSEKFLLNFLKKFNIILCGNETIMNFKLIPYCFLLKKKLFLTDTNLIEIFANNQLITFNSNTIQTLNFEQFTVNESTTNNFEIVKKFLYDKNFQKNFEKNIFNN